ncbi:MAG: gamma-glutamyltransferase [Proteobacteria bacterium]|nr:gamma-glutamyltransferase [Pseudomonadota bacterium]
MRSAFLSISILLCSTWVFAAAPPPAEGNKGMVASDHELSSAAGAIVLDQGGNAVDAMIATVLAAGVVQPAGSGLGGGGFAVWHDTKDGYGTLDFREVAPSQATRDMFSKSQLNNASQDGGLAVAVPGEGQGLIELHRRFGSRPLRELALPAIELAKRGFSVGPQLAKSFARLDDPNGFTAQFLGIEQAPQRGDHIERPRLAKAIKAWVKTEGRALVDGWVAQDWVSTAKKSGGILEVSDIVANQPREREPVVGSYRGWKVVSMAPPSSGGVVLLQVLKVLEASELSKMGHNSAELLHLYVETMQHAFADRAHFMGDPDRVEVPVEDLLCEDRIEAVRAAFDAEKTLSAEEYGAPVDAGNDAGTQHISIIDKNGFAVALTTTINTTFGSKVVGEKSGVVLNNQMDDFVAQPGAPNAYGLVGSEANAVAPGAVPLSSMSPTILVSPDGTQRIAIGASGGPFIITSTLQSIINIIDFEMNPSEAVSAPRVHHQWQPRQIFLDVGISSDTESLLIEKGHKVTHFEHYSSVQVVHWDGEIFRGASDPRKGGWPVGVR